MRQNLRTQLLLSHLVLIGLMLIVMVGGVISVFHLGRSIDRILWRNQRSVLAAQEMKEDLERQDSAATFYLAGQTEKARNQYRTYRDRFEAQYSVEAHNITEPGEQQAADDIRRCYAAYTVSLERLLYADPPMATADARAYYFGTLEPQFVRLKQRAQDVLDINQSAIERADARAKAEARDASWTGIAVAVAAFAAAMALALRMVTAALLPLRILARQAEEIGAGRLNQRIELHRRDEVGALAAAFNQMSQKLLEARHIEEQRLERAERMSDAAIDSLYDPVLVTDGRGCVVHLNRAAEELFGPVSGSVGRGIAEVVPEARIAQAVDRAIQQERVSAPEDEAGFIPFQVDGTQRTYRLRVAPMRDDDGTLLGAVTVLEDVTHLRELDRMKTEFIGVASHELRTPVTSLQLAVQLLDEGAAGELSPKQRQLVTSAREDVDRLERMMRDLLELTRLEAGVTALHPEPAPPQALIEEAERAVRPQAKARGLALTVDAPRRLPDVLADRAQVVRALTNLLGNAIRHTPSGGRVELSARAAGPMVAIDVRDTGVGIPPEYRQRIFERFVQVPGATRGGAGLGLSIAQTIARAHGGDITVQSEIGQGSTFTVTLPVGQGAGTVVGSAGPVQERGQGR